MTVRVRNSTDQNGMYLAMRQDEWLAFVAGVKNGDFDGP